MHTKQAQHMTNRQTDSVAGWWGLHVYYCLLRKPSDRARNTRRGSCPRVLLKYSLRFLTAHGPSVRWRPAY
eukprot:944315-Prymnesium_polylepis.1